jgi:deoxyribodipyrimidine photo-lyase
MATQKVQEARVQNLNDEEVRDGDYVLYWMQSSQRAQQNHALEYAVQQANDLDQRLFVVFGLTDVSLIAYNHPRAT